jgi:hypothetical protein
MAGRYDIVVDRGATLLRTFAVTDANQAPVPYAGYTGRMQVRRDHSSSTVLLDATTSNGKLTINGAAGTISLNVSDEETANLSATTAYYDLMLTSTAGQSFKLLEGQFIVRPTVTRP